MRWFCACCLSLLNLSGHGQGLLKGIVLDSLLRKPLTNATVFLSGTSIGVKTDERGRFTIKFPPAKYNLVAIQRGFETGTQIVDGKKPLDSITVFLKPRPKSGRKGPFPGYTKTNWENWVGFFLQNLLGTAENPAYCSIKNLASVDFYLSKDSTELIASSDEPLVIQNKFLGYTILYQIESFRYHPSTPALFYGGYTFFQPMQGGRSKQKEWQANRATAYSGSMMHFMRSLYVNKLEGEGFEARHLRKVPNLPDQDALDLSQSRLPGGSDTTKNGYLLGTFRDQVYNPDNYKDIIGLPLPGDSIAYAIDQTTAALEFADFLLVVYHDKDAATRFPLEIDQPSMTSQLLLTGGKPVQVEFNGSYFNRGDLLVLGYWSWAEKIPTMLPFDYVPAAH